MTHVLDRLTGDARGRLQRQRLRNPVSHGTKRNAFRRACTSKSGLNSTSVANNSGDGPSDGLAGASTFFAPSGAGANGLLRVGNEKEKPPPEAASAGAPPLGFESPDSMLFGAFAFSLPFAANVAWRGSGENSRFAARFIQTQAARGKHHPSRRLPQCSCASTAQGLTAAHRVISSHRRAAVCVALRTDRASAAAMASGVAVDDDSDLAKEGVEVVRRTAASRPATARRALHTSQRESGGAATPQWQAAERACPAARAAARRGKQRDEPLVRLPLGPQQLGL